MSLIRFPVINTLTPFGRKYAQTPNASSADTEISQRINLLRFLLIFGIILIHTHPVVPVTATGSSAFDFVKALFQHAIFRCSVPMLTCISGYLLFQASLDLKYRELIVKKVQTLLIPFIIFNVIIALVLFSVQSKQLMDHEFSRKLYPFESKNWVEAVFGLSTLPINYPLGFLRDLFVISLLAPLAGLLIRNFAWSGLVVTTLVFWFNLDGDLVHRSHMPTAFYIGGMAAVCRWDLKRLDKHAVGLLLALVAFSVAIVVLQIENTNFLRLFAPLMVWPAASLLVNTSVGVRIAKLAKYSFLAFLVHAPILVISWVVYQKALSSVVPYWIFWIVTPVIATAASIGLHVLGYRLMPKAMNFLLGGRRKSTATTADQSDATTFLPEPTPGFARAVNRPIIRTRRTAAVTAKWKPKESPAVQRKERQSYSIKLNRSTEHR